MESHRQLLILFFAEFAGSAIYLSLGCLSTLSLGVFVKGHVEIALTFGLVLLICVHVFRPFSGGHVNPWVSTAAFILGHIKWEVWLRYLIAQVLGAFFGFGILYVIVPEKYFKNKASVVYSSENGGIGLCMAKPGDDFIKDSQIVLAQFLCMSVFILMWAGSWDKRGAYLDEAFAVRIGLVYLGCNICAGYLTGGSLNLLHSVVPVAVHGGWKKIWKAIIGQFVGTVLISVIWRFVFVNNFEQDDENEV